MYVCMYIDDCVSKQIFGVCGLKELLMQLFLLNSLHIKYWVGHTVMQLETQQLL